MLTGAARRLARGMVDAVPDQLKWRLLGPPPIRSLGSLWSIISPYHDQPAPPPALLRLLLEASNAALDTRFEPGGVFDRCNPEQRIRLNDWPGHHYRLLAALSDLLKPSLVVEIGTFTGMSALAAVEHVPKGSRVVTYDVIPWKQFGDRSVLRESDFGARLEQRIGDLSDKQVFDRNRSLLAEADMFFVDGPKDGRFEQVLLPQLFALRRGGPSGLLILDDVRVMNMVSFWHNLTEPKLDATSLGHWSGTGLVQLGDPH